MLYPITKRVDLTCFYHKEGGEGGEGRREGRKEGKKEGRKAGRKEETLRARCLER